MTLKDWDMSDVLEVQTDNTIIIGTHNVFVKTFIIPIRRLSVNTQKLFKQLIKLAQNNQHLIYPNLILGFAPNESTENILNFRAIDPKTRIGYIINVIP
jgi:hypothetical protein